VISERSKRGRKRRDIRLEELYSVLLIIIAAETAATAAKTTILSIITHLVL
jgi:hypothetical protein